MTIDKQKLKALAEAAPPGPWLAENDSLYFKDDGYTRHMLDADSGMDVEEDKYYAALAFIAAANPASVLSLLAEIERLRSGVDSDMAEIQRIQAEYDKKFRQARELRAERDQLKAENEALRKDAERYRWITENADVDCRGHEMGREHGSLDECIDAAMAKESSRD